MSGSTETGVAAGRAEIALQNPNRYPEVPALELRVWVARMVEELAPAGSSLAVRFVGDRAMKRFNATFRDKSDTTDVLSFPGDGASGQGHLGDIAISVPTARRRADEAGRPVAMELQVLILHGLLHCLGYDHESDDGEMERLERRLRRRWIGANA